MLPSINVRKVPPSCEEPADPFLSFQSLLPRSTGGPNSYPKHRDSWTLYFHALTNASSRNSHRLILLQMPRGCGHPKAKSRRNFAHSPSQRSTFQPPNTLSPLDRTLTRNAPVSPLELTLTKYKDLKSRRIILLQKRLGGGEASARRARAGSEDTEPDSFRGFTYDLPLTTATAYLRPICRLLRTRPLRENRGPALLNRGQTL